MTARPATILLLSCSLCWLLPGCAERPPASERPEAPTGPLVAPGSGPRPLVVVTAPVVDWLVAELAGELVERRTIEGGTDAPSAEAIAGAASADLIVAHGGGLEPWLATANLPESRLLVAGGQWIMVDGETHTHGPGAEHSHRGPDPFSWLDPAQLDLEARGVAARLATLGEPLAAAVPARLTRLLSELDALSAGLAEARELLAGQRLAATGGHYRYLAQALAAPLREVSLAGEQRALELEELRRWLEPNHTRLLLCSTELGGGLESELAQNQIEIVFLDRMIDSSGRAGFDYISRMKRNVEALRAALGAPLEATP